MGKSQFSRKRKRSVEERDEKQENVDHRRMALSLVNTVTLLKIRGRHVGIVSEYERDVEAELRKDFDKS